MLIDSLCAKYKIDQSRIYLVGESLGASGALNLAIHYPERFAAVVPFSMFYVLTKNAAMQLKNTPVWLFYGANDERIAPRVKKEIQMDLISAGVPLKYTEVPEMGHRIWNGITDKYPDLLPWLFNQKKTPSMARQ
jgi:predicted peptidase